MIDYKNKEEQVYVAPACKAFQIKLRKSVCQDSEFTMGRSSDTSDFQREEGFVW